MTLCPSPEELPTWFALADDDPRRLHAEECPRCLSWWLEYQEFEEASGSARSPDVEEAVAHLNLPHAPFRSRPVPQRRWLIAASIPLLAGGLWWASMVQEPSPIQWRGQPIPQVTTPFRIEYDGDTLLLAKLSSDVIEVRWLWIGEDLGVIERSTWRRDFEFAGSDLQTEVTTAPTRAAFWQIEWTLEDGTTGSGSLERLTEE